MGFSIPNILYLIGQVLHKSHYVKPWYMALSHIPVTKKSRVVKEKVNPIEKGLWEFGLWRKTIPGTKSVLSPSEAFRERFIIIWHYGLYSTLPVRGQFQNLRPLNGPHHPFYLS
ncbi:hypothetical protein F8C76_08240 [Flagellimonas olearia]|uniref:Uncharacterized protein n=1 Tax=Flagellimonas olearia TaxID=552546 RepID=A0A6I1E1G1_9FLAO|nr:hypothetical protein [Allomuricauda olearia]KAB7531468.1 hypothetical protein F8C76_08240 [Allomuricauda olearia]